MYKSFDPAFLPLGIYPKEMFKDVQKIQLQPQWLLQNLEATKYSGIGNWLSKLQYGHRI